MNSIVLVNIARFIGLLLFQVLILNQIELHGFISPYIYPLFILLLPFETPRWLQMVLAFIAGLLVDMFANTPGLHASATVFMAYLRQPIIQLNKPPGDYQAGDRPNIKSMGFKWFIFYITVAIVLHHIFYFFIEIYSLQYFFYTLIKIILSTATSILLIILYQYLFYSDI